MDAKKIVFIFFDRRSPQTMAEGAAISFVKLPGDSIHPIPTKPLDGWIADLDMVLSSKNLNAKHVEVDDDPTFDDVVIHTGLPLKIWIDTPLANLIRWPAGLRIFSRQVEGNTDSGMLVGFVNREYVRSESARGITAHRAIPLLFWLLSVLMVILFVMVLQFRSDSSSVA